MPVHASVYKGCAYTNTKTFLHNSQEMLEQVLKQAKDKHRTKLVVVDGVYSQDGDTAPVKDILNLCRGYGPFLR